MRMARRRLARRVRLWPLRAPVYYPLAYPAGYRPPYYPPPETVTPPAEDSSYKDLLAWTGVAALVIGGLAAARALLR